VVADLLDLAQQVGGDHHGPAFGGDAGDQFPDLPDAGRVEPIGRLVEDEQFGVAQQSGRDAEPLLHPERVGPEVIVAPPGQTDLIEHGRDPAAVPAPGGGENSQVLLTCQPGIEGG